MTMGSLSRAGPTGAMVSWLRQGLLPIFLTLGAIVCGLLVIQGSQVRAVAEAEKARAMEEEDRVFCTGFGVGPGTTRHSECAEALKDVRSRHDQRNTDPF